MRTRLYSSHNREAIVIADLLQIEPTVTTPLADTSRPDYFARGAAADGDGCGHQNTEADTSTYGLPPRFDRRTV